MKVNGEILQLPTLHLLQTSPGMMGSQHLEWIFGFDAIKDAHVRQT
jgi:hypothetical protein